MNSGLATYVIVEAAIVGALLKKVLQKSAQNHPKKIRGEQFQQSDGSFGPSFNKNCSPPQMFPKQF